MQSPERIDNDLAHGRLLLAWADAAVWLEHATLRRACRCAECQFKRRHGIPVDAPRDVRIIAIAPAGYGVQFVFSDGHARGLFPWPYLAALGVSAEG